MTKTEKVHFLNTEIHNLSLKETLSSISKAISENRQIHHVVVNAAKVVQMQDDLTLRQSVNTCDLINADGQAVVWASRFLGKPLKERVTGIDLMYKLVQLAAQKKYQVYFLGAKEHIVQSVVTIFENQFGKSIVAGYRNGYFTEEEQVHIAQEIASSGAHILFVAISSPTKENFLFKYRDILKSVNFIMGVGGSFDVVAGKTKRAPLWMQKSGLEWLYRLIQEPKRMWKRYLIGNAKFIFLVLQEKWRFRNN